MNIALVGNPNSGKTTLFNALTGNNAKTGNFAGVTTEKKVGLFKRDKTVKITDLPGIYSFASSSNDKKAATEFIKRERVDVIINVVDGTNLIRNLYLTALLSKLKIPVVIAVNMCDDLTKNGMSLNLKELVTLFGMPVVPVSALKRTNLRELMSVAVKCKPPANEYKGEESEIYAFLEDNIGKIIERKETKRERTTKKIDGVLLNKYLGIPVMILFMTLVFFLTMKIGGFFSVRIERAINSLSKGLKGKFTENALPDWFITLSCDAVISGVGAVFSFLPQVLILFGLMSVIEESGYAARIAFLTDKILKKAGLGGRSVISLVLSCGCTVSGILSTRTIEDEEERKRTIFLTAFMPCGAKTAVFSWLSFVLFGGNPFIPVFAYFFGVFATAFFGRLLIRKKRTEDDAFILEMPSYRLPAVSTVIKVLFEKTKDFLLKVGSTVFLVSVALWLLKNFGLSGYTGGGEKSFLYLLGNAVKYIFIPLGFGNAAASVSLISGIFAKESVAETLKLLSSDVGALFSSPFSAFAFMVFLLLSPPCVAALSSAKGELNKKVFVKMIAFQFSAGYFFALAVNMVGIVIYGKHLILGLLFVIIFLGALATKIIKKRGKICKKIRRRSTTICVNPIIKKKTHFSRKR